MPISEAKLKKLSKGQIIQLKHSELPGVANSLHLSDANKKKMMRAHSRGCGLRLQLDGDEIEENVGCGLMSMAKKGAKFVRNNKELNALKDQAMDAGMNYALDKAGVGDEMKQKIGKASKSLVNQAIDGSGFGIGKAMKYANKGLKVANKVGNAMGYDNLEDMAINTAVKQTVGRIDPTLGDITAHALNKAVDGAQKKYGGSFKMNNGYGLNPYLPEEEQDQMGGSLSFLPRDQFEPQLPMGVGNAPDNRLRNYIMANHNVRHGRGFKMNN